MSDRDDSDLEKTPPSSPKKTPPKIKPPNTKQNTTPESEDKWIPKVRPECDKRFFTLNCFFDNGGTPNGCHLDPFDNYNQLLKHSKENHSGGEFACQFCGMYFANLEDKKNHEGEFFRVIVACI